MKTIAILLALGIGTGILAFKPLDKELEKGLIKPGDTFSFSNKNNAAIMLNSLSFKKGSYDGSGFWLQIDEGRGFILSRVSQSKGPKQDEFFVFGCTGNLSRSGRDLTIKLEKTGHRYYLFDFDNSRLIDSFEAVTCVVLTAEASGKPAAYFCYEKSYASSGKDDSQVRTVRLTAVPTSLKHEDLFTPTHAPEAIARFTTIKVETKEGKTRDLPPGSYILCEGSSFGLK